MCYPAGVRELQVGDKVRYTPAYIEAGHIAKASERRGKVVRTSPNGAFVCVQWEGQRASIFCNRKDLWRI